MRATVTNGRRRRRRSNMPSMASVRLTQRRGNLEMRRVIDRRVQYSLKTLKNGVTVITAKHEDERVIAQFQRYWVAVAQFKRVVLDAEEARLGTANDDALHTLTPSSTSLQSSSSVWYVLFVLSLVSALFTLYALGNGGVSTRTDAR